MHTPEACCALNPLARRAQVEPIVAEVREEGDAAVRRYTSKFDRVELDSVCVRIEVSFVLSKPREPLGWGAFWLAACRLTGR